MSNEGKDRRQFFWRLLYNGARMTLARRCNYTCEPIEVDGPFLLISNHVTNNDPFFVGLAHGGSPLTYVASEHIFRLGFVSKLITKLLDPIPRSKAASGASTVKNCLRRIKNGEAVALFAEGDCTWDGRSAEVFPATGKLSKACGAPLVTFRIEGGYLTRPRWAKRPRRGSMHGAPVKVYGVDELKGMAPEEVTAAINRDIYEDAWLRQAEEGSRFVGKGKAEGLENGFYICPGCGGMELASHGDTLCCADCGTTVRVEDTGRFDIRFGNGIGAPAGAAFETAAEWDAWQRERMEGIIRGEYPEPKTEPFECRFTVLDESGRRKRVKEAPRKAMLSLSIRDRRMALNGEELPFDGVSAMSMVKTNRLLYTTADGYYELKTGKGCLRRVLNSWQAAKRLCEKEEV